MLDCLLAQVDIHCGLLGQASHRNIRQFHRLLGLQLAFSFVLLDTLIFAWASA
jgi:hypothetical protein